MPLDCTPSRRPVICGLERGWANRVTIMSVSRDTSIWLISHFVYYSWQLNENGNIPVLIKCSTCSVLLPAFPDLSWADAKERSDMIACPGCEVKYVIRAGRCVNCPNGWITRTISNADKTSYPECPSCKKGIQVSVVDVDPRWVLISLASWNCIDWFFTAENLRTRYTISTVTNGLSLIWRIGFR